MENVLTRTIAPEDSGPAPEEPVACTAETAECTCPDYCERDHGNE
jgi:hypothetical protein